MASNTIFEEDDFLHTLVARVEAGEEIVITRHGKPVARLETLPTLSDADRSRALKTLEEMTRHAQAMNVGPYDWEEWKAYRDEGRR